jgi:hypothetical protein
MSTSFPAGSTPAEERLAEGRRRYSICTLVTDPERYSDLVSSFIAHGFAPTECEFLYLDNSAGNRFDAYQGVNLFLRVALGDYIIICHQDIELLNDGRDRLDAVIGELDKIEPTWGVFGNAGGLPSGGLARRISDPQAEDDRQGGPFPIPVVSLDENFIVVRADANIAASADLRGFHL